MKTMNLNSNSNNLKQSSSNDFINFVKNWQKEEEKIDKTHYKRKEIIIDYSDSYDFEEEETFENTNECESNDLNKDNDAEKKISYQGQNKEEENLQYHRLIFLLFCRN